MNSRMHLGSTFNAQKYHELEQEAQEEYDANNQKPKRLRLQRNKFSFRATVKKITSVRKSLMSRIRKQNEPLQHSDSMDVSKEYVNPPVISSAILSKVVKDIDGKLKLEHLPIEKGHVHRMIVLLEPHFKGQKVSEKFDSERCSRSAGNPMTTQVTPPSPVVVQDWNSSKTKLVQHSLEKSLGIRKPFASSDKVTEQNFLCSEVTRAPSGQSATGFEENGALSVDDERDDLNTSRTQHNERQPPHRFYHQLPVMEKVPPIEQGLVQRLTKQIETQLRRSTLDGHLGGPPLHLKSSSLTSSSGGSNECDGKGNRSQRWREHNMKVAEGAQSHNDDQVSVKATHASMDDKNSSLICDDLVNDDYVALRLKQRRERIMKSLEACLGN